MGAKTSKSSNDSYVQVLVKPTEIKKGKRTKIETKIETQVDTKVEIKFENMGYQELNLLLVQHGIIDSSFCAKLTKFMVKHPNLRNRIFEKILTLKQENDIFSTHSIWSLADEKKAGQITLYKFYLEIYPNDFLVRYVIALRYNQRKKYTLASTFIEDALTTCLRHPRIYTHWPDITSQIYALRAQISENIGNKHDYRSNMLLAIETCVNSAIRHTLIVELKNNDEKSGDIIQVYEEFAKMKNERAKMMEKIQILENELSFRPGGPGAKIAGLDFEEYKIQEKK